jgi:hypothetical protein
MGSLSGWWCEHGSARCTGSGGGEAGAVPVSVGCVLGTRVVPGAMCGATELAAAVRAGHRPQAQRHTRGSSGRSSTNPAPRSNRNATGAVRASWVDWCGMVGSIIGGQANRLLLGQRYSRQGRVFRGFAHLHRFEPPSPRADSSPPRLPVWFPSGTWVAASHLPTRCEAGSGRDTLRRTGGASDLVIVRGGRARRGRDGRRLQVDARSLRWG